MQNEILIEADKIINGERQEQYGSAEDSFALIANYWNDYFNASKRDLLMAQGWDEYINEHDVAMMMILLKVARTNGTKKKDNYVDIAGYAALAARL